MVLNDTTNYNGLLQRCEHWTNLGTGAITGDADLKKQFINHINVAQHELFMLALESQDGLDVDDHKHGDLKYFTTPLTTNRSYTFDISNRILEWERVDVSYDGTEYNRAQPIDSKELGYALGNDDNVDDRFTKVSPYYDPKGNYIDLYPKAEQADVDAGGEIRMEWSRETNEFALDGSDDSKEAFIARPFHEQIAIQAAYKWLIVNKSSNGSLLSRIEGLIQRGEDAIKNHFSNRLADQRFVLGSSVKHKDYE